MQYKKLGSINSGKGVGIVTYEHVKQTEGNSSKL